MKNNFQTPLSVCRYMASLVPSHYRKILEPTPGDGNLVLALCEKSFSVSAPEEFQLRPREHFDAVVMNPPFSPMKDGYEILAACMEQTNMVIALMPWLAIINGQSRLQSYRSYGLYAVTHLPRSTFPGSRVQTCILELRRSYQGPTALKFFPQ